MEFEVFNRDGIPLMKTKSVECIPDENSITTMLNSGYKIKLNGRPTTKKLIQEYIKKEKEKISNEQNSNV